MPPPRAPPPPPPTNNCAVIVTGDCYFFVAICADGSYYKYSFSGKGDAHRDSYCKFLQMTDD